MLGRAQSSAKAKPREERDTVVRYGLSYALQVWLPPQRDDMLRHLRSPADAEKSHQGYR